MRRTKHKKQLKPSSYIILAELAEANRLFEVAIEKGGNLKSGTEEYDRISAAAEAKLDALALQDPEEATRIYIASPYFDEGIDPDLEVYLGHGIFLPREDLAAYDTPEKRAALLEEAEEE